MSSILWALAKGFIPVFRFFEAGDILPVLEIRKTKEDSAWKPWLSPSSIHAIQLFHSPELNMKLYFYSLAHELTQEHLEQKTVRHAEKKIIRILLFSEKQIQYQIRNKLTDHVIYTSEWFYAES